VSPRAASLAALLFVASALAAHAASAEGEPRASVVVTVEASPEDPPVRYVPRAIELEVGATPIAAWQVELVVRSGEATIVGVEGGTAEGFREPPYYDPKALAGGRIVLAAFDTRASLPPGRHRVATLHLREAGSRATYELALLAASAPDGSPAAAQIHLVGAKGEQR
jgi:hypothetical protein